MATALRIECERCGQQDRAVLVKSALVLPSNWRLVDQDAGYPTIVICETCLEVYKPDESQIH